jgi:hypothetical protein
VRSVDGILVPYAPVISDARGRNDLTRNATTVARTVRVRVRCRSDATCVTCVEQAEDSLGQSLFCKRFDTVGSTREFARMFLSAKSTPTERPFHEIRHRFARRGVNFVTVKHYGRTKTPPRFC